MLFHAILEQEKQYASILPGAGNEVQLIWIKLNMYDNEPGHFWRTFITALTPWNFPFCREQRQLSFPDNNGRHITEFLDAFSKLLAQKPLALLLDNTMKITNDRILSFFHALKEITAENFSLILVSGSIKHHTTQKGPFFYNWPLQYPISRQDEQHYYKTVAFEVTDEELSVIRQYTDGWPGAVQCMAHFLSRDKALRLNDLDSRFIAWLETFFLASYTQPELELLILLALLDELPLEFISYSTGWSGENLMPIIADSPIMRKKETGDCFCFAEFALPYIRRRQVLLSNKQKQDFLFKAGRWYHQRGQTVAAVTYYQKAKATEQVLEVILSYQLPGSREEAHCFVNAIGELPADLFDRHPMLHVIHAYVLCTLYRYEDAFHVLEQFCSAKHQDGTMPETVAAALGEAYTLLTYISDMLLSYQDELIPLFEKAMALLTKGNKTLSAKVSMFADRPMIRLPSPEAGSMARYLAFLEKIEPYANKLSHDMWPISSELAAAELLFYQRSFKHVEVHARLAINTALSKGHIDTACSACFLLMRLAAAKGNHRKLFENFSKLKQYAAMASYDVFFTMPDLAEGWLQLVLGKPNHVAKWLRDESLYQETILPINYGRSSIIRAYYLLQTHQHSTLLAYARGSLDLLGKRHYNINSIYMTMMIAIVHHMQQDYALSVKAFEAVYRWCSPNGLIMPVVEFGRYVRPLADDYLRSGHSVIDAEWLNEVTQKAKTYALYEYNLRTQTELSRDEKHNPLEPLTAAEKSLLLMISRGMTTQEVAAALNRSLNTVKGMTRRLYTKLGVNGKADAVRLATEYHIEDLAEV